jgi:hypothetical protein
VSGAEEIIEAGRALVAAADERDATLRMLGGAAVILHAPATLGGRPHRELGDLDVIVDRASARAAAAAFAALGYEPDRRFNAMQGDRRMIFEGPIGKVDVFVDSFEMCHRLDLAPRLGLDAETITATDLLLTKLQIHELTQKDVEDLEVLLVEHPLGYGPGDHIDLDHLGAVVADDWGLWRSATGTLTDLAARRPSVAPSAEAIAAAMTEAPKTRQFRMRARLGERKRWYQLPDEIE